MFDQFPNTPDFQLCITGGTFEENAQMTTAVHHALSMCGFTGLSIDSQSSLTPGYHNSSEVLNAIRALNPDLFEAQMHISGVCEQDQIAAMRMQTMPQYGMPSPWYSQQ